MAVPVRLGTDVVLGRPQAVVKGPYAVASVQGVITTCRRMVSGSCFEELKARVPTKQ